MLVRVYWRVFSEYNPTLLLDNTCKRIRYQYDKDLSKKVLEKTKQFLWLSYQLFSIIVMAKVLEKKSSSHEHTRSAHMANKIVNCIPSMFND